MARGKKIEKEIVYKIMMSMFVTGNSIETAKELALPESTIRSIYSRYKDKEEFIKLRSKKQDEFVETATRIINKATMLLERKLDTAISKQEELEKILDDIEDLKDKDADYKRKKSLAAKIEAMQLNKITDLTTALGTLYDKRALAKGEATENSNITINMSDEVKELAK